MSESMQTCSCCGMRLNPARIVWLELDRRINCYHDFGGIPESSNQGGFPFGPRCAAKNRKMVSAALAKATGKTM